MSHLITLLYPGDDPGLDLVEKYLKYGGLDEEPNYNRCREILKKGLPTKPRSMYLKDSFEAIPKKKGTKRSTAAANVSESRLVESFDGNLIDMLSSSSQDSRRKPRSIECNFSEAGKRRV